MRKILFERNALVDYKEWAIVNPIVYSKINSLLRNTLVSPFTGIGKPEPLKHELKGFWSRRINKEHRLVYKVTKTEIIVISCRYHYS